jgi:hypothetical protein
MQPTLTVRLGRGVRGPYHAQLARRRTLASSRYLTEFMPNISGVPGVGQPASFSRRSNCDRSFEFAGAHPQVVRPRHFDSSAAQKKYRELG